MKWAADSPCHYLCDLSDGANSISEQCVSDDGGNFQVNGLDALVLHG